MSLSSDEYFLLSYKKHGESHPNTNYLALGDAILLPKGNMKTCLLTYQDKPLTTKIGGGLESVSVAFQPREETRKGIVFKITEEDYNELNFLGAVGSRCLKGVES